MKNALLFLSLFVASSVMAQDSDSTGLEGDNLDLNAVLEIFKESESPEDFEQKLNTEGTSVNNLDLDNDGEVDYIRVVETGDTAAHVLTLQVPVNETESQDVAVIEMEQTAKDTVNLQVIGDEELYGENYILVPQSQKSSIVRVNVNMWKPIRHMYAPKHVFYVSPWRHKHHPHWYKPWKRVHWNVYHARVKHHHGHCRRVSKPHFNHAHSFYHRTHSPKFHANHHHKHVNPGGKGAASKTTVKTKTVQKKTVSPKQKSSSRQIENRKRPGAANDNQSKTKTKSKTKKTKTTRKSSSTKKKKG